MRVCIVGDAFHHALVGFDDPVEMVLAWTMRKVGNKAQPVEEKHREADSRDDVRVEVGGGANRLGAVARQD